MKKAESRIQNSEGRIQKAEFRIQNPEFRTCCWRKRLRNELESSMTEDEIILAQRENLFPPSGKERIHGRKSIL
jgi:hypothetical protein